METTLVYFLLALFFAAGIACELVALACLILELENSYKLRKKHRNRKTSHTDEQRDNGNSL